MWWVGLRCHDATRLTDKIRPDPTEPTRPTLPDPTYPTKVSGRLMATRPDPTDPTKPDRPDHKSDMVPACPKYISGKLRSFSKNFSKNFFHTTLFENFLPNGVSVAAAKNQPSQGLGTPENRP